MRHARSRSEISSSGFCASLNTPNSWSNDIKQIESAWPEKVLKRQRDWVGRSEGAFIDFAVKDSDKKIRVFTTRIDTIFGATAIVLSAEHPLH